MAHLQFESAPSVQPETRPPNDFQQIQTNPREFGSAIGAGLEHLGAGVTDVSHLYGQIAADDQVNHVISGLDDLQSKMLSLRGKDAMDQAPAIRQQMSDLMNQARGNLFTADQVIQFNNQARILYSRADRTVVDHADQQTKVWGGEVNKSAQDLAVNGAAQAAGAGDMVAAEAHTQDAVRAAVRNAQLLYGQDLAPDSPILQDAMREARAQSLRLQVNAMIPANPAGAQTLLNQNAKDFNPLEYEALSQRLEGASADATAQQFVYHLPGPPAAGAAPLNIPPSQSLASVVSSGQIGPLIDHLIQREGGSPKGVINNPGNIKFTGAPDQTDSGVHASDGGTFASYQTPEAGRSAIAGLITRAATGQSPAYGAAPSVSSFISTYEGHGQSPPGLESALNQVYTSDMTPKAKDRAAELTRLRYSSEWTDQTRAHEMQERAQKQASDDAENAIIQDAASPQPRITAQQIANNPALTPEAKLRMIKFAGSDGKVDPGASQRETMTLLDDMRKPGNDPTHIGDMTPIIDAFSQGKLTREDFSFLQNQFKNFRAPNGDKLASIERDFTKGMQSSITRSNPLMGQLDREGDRKFYEFNWMVHQKIAQYYRQEGKNPFDLFDPAKPDYLGKPEAIRPYTTSLQQSSQNITDALGLQVPQPTAQPGAPAAPPAILPRQPGESIPDYMKRAGIGPPGTH